MWWIIGILFVFWAFLRLTCAIVYVPAHYVELHEKPWTTKERIIGALLYLALFSFLAWIAD